MTTNPLTRQQAIEVLRDVIESHYLSSPTLRTGARARALEALHVLAVDPLSVLSVPQEQSVRADGAGSFKVRDEVSRLIDENPGKFYRSQAGALIAFVQRAIDSVRAERAPSVLSVPALPELHPTIGKLLAAVDSDEFSPDTDLHENAPTHAHVPIAAWMAFYTAWNDWTDAGRPGLSPTTPSAVGGERVRADGAKGDPWATVTPTTCGCGHDSLGHAWGGICVAAGCKCERWTMHPQAAALFRPKGASSPAPISNRDLDSAETQAWGEVPAVAGADAARIQASSEDWRTAGRSEDRYQRDACLARYGRWGTCVDCPRRGGVVYPEWCVNTERYDHQLGPPAEGAPSPSPSATPLEERVDALCDAVDRCSHAISVIASHHGDPPYAFIREALGSVHEALAKARGSR